MNTTTFDEALRGFIHQTQFKPDQIAKLTGLPRDTILNWMKGRVKKPRSWQDILNVAGVLHLDMDQANTLLRAADYPGVVELMRTAEEADKKLFNPWSGNILPQKKEAPFQVIPDLPYFAGRKQIIQELLNLLGESLHTGPIALVGMGGVGKTTLAAKLAYLVKDKFPDGVLWAQVDKTNTLAILNSFAEAYGRDVSRYRDLESRSQVVREVLANKRVLIVLDNAEESKQVIPLLPPTGPAVVIITTRRQNLSVLRGAHRFNLLPFDLETRESLELFQNILGKEVMIPIEHELWEMAGLLGHLPLAIDITASRLEYEIGLKVHDLIQDFHHEKHVLDKLNYEDASLRGTFSLSYEKLDQSQKQLFLACALFDGEDFSLEAAGQIAGLPPDQAQESLNILYALSLVQKGRAERARLHPLLKDFAKEKIVDLGLRKRLIDWSIELVSENKRKFELLAIESDNILGAFHNAMQDPVYSSLVDGVNNFFYFLEVRGFWTTAEELSNQSLKIAKDNNNLLGEARTLRNLGRLARFKGELQKSEQYLEEGIAMARQVQKMDVVASLLLEIGTLSDDNGRYDLAEQYYCEGLQIAKRLDDNENVCAFMINLGSLEHTKGNVTEAEKYYLDALPIAQAVGRRDWVCGLMMGFGNLLIDRGDIPGTQRQYREALKLAREIGDKRNIITILSNLAEFTPNVEEARSDYLEVIHLSREIGQPSSLLRPLVLLAQLDYYQGFIPQAKDQLQEALEISRSLGYQDWICATLTTKGWIAANQGDFSLAEDCFTEGMSIADQLGYPLISCELLYSIGNLALIRKDYLLAESRFNEGLEVARKLGRPIEIAGQLSGLGQTESEMGFFEKAMQSLQEGLSLALTTDIRGSLIGEILFSLGELSLKTSNVDEAFNFMREALKRSQESKNKPLEGNCLYLHSKLENARGHFTDALSKAEEALSILEKLELYTCFEVRDWMSKLRKEVYGKQE